MDIVFFELQKVPKPLSDLFIITDVKLQLVTLSPSQQMIVSKAQHATKIQRRLRQWTVTLLVNTQDI